MSNYNKTHFNPGRLARLGIGTPEKLPVVEGVEAEIQSMVDRAETLLDLLSEEQNARYEHIAHLNLEVNRHEKIISRGAELSHQLEQLRGVLVKAVEEKAENGKR